MIQGIIDIADKIMLNALAINSGLCFIRSKMAKNIYQHVHIKDEKQLEYAEQTLKIISLSKYFDEDTEQYPKG